LIPFRFQFVPVNTSYKHTTSGTSINRPTATSFWRVTQLPTDWWKPMARLRYLRYWKLNAGEPHCM